MEQNIDLLALPVVNTPTQGTPPQQDADAERQARIAKRNTALPLRPSLYPVILRDILGNAAKTRRHPSFVAAMTVLSALIARVLHRYPTEDKLSTLCLHAIIEGRQASGKGFAESIYHLLVDPTLGKHDKEQVRQAQDYREEQQEVNGTDKLRPKPRVNIRCISPKISENELATYLVNQEHLFDGETLPFLSFTPELDTAVKATKSKYSDLQAENRIGWDYGSHLVRHYSSTNSVPCDSELNTSLLYLGTPGAVNRYMNTENIEAGSVSRHIICEIDDGLGAPPAIKKPYSKEQLDSINHWLTLIMADTYTADGQLQPMQILDMSWLYPEVMKWLRNTAEKVKASGSIAFNDFYHRSPVSTVRETAICYYLYLLELRVLPEEEIAGRLPEIQRRCKKIFRYEADYNLDAMLDRWGQEYDEMQQAIMGKRCNSRQIKGGILNLLPDQFSRDDFLAIYEKEGLKGRPRALLYYWKHDGFIKAIDKDHFQKV